MWFHNVEYIASEKIGQQTVTYVSNIYKYYIAYRLVLESQAAQEASGREDSRAVPTRLPENRASTKEAVEKFRVALTRTRTIMRAGVMDGVSPKSRR